MLPGSCIKLRPGQNFPLRRLSSLPIITNQVTQNYPKPPPPPRKFAQYAAPESFHPNPTDSPYFWFELVHKSAKSWARVGRIHTPHGIIDTPGFVAVGTNGTLKALDTTSADETGLQLMFCNTYHLLLQPGPDVVKAAGGLHKFMNRNKPIITDSGGFQVFSLAYGSVDDEINMKARKKTDDPSHVISIDERGVTFRSYRDGRLVKLTPEISVATQKALGADIIIPLDELPPYHIEPERLRESLHRTHRWEARSLLAHTACPNKQAMYAVVHGGIDPVLRQESIDFLSSLPFDGFAIGGSLGKNRDELIELLKYVMPRIPQHIPNHLLGIADDQSIEMCVPHGVDTFDSCYPTRAARHGTLFTRKGRVHIHRQKNSHVFEPLDPECCCRACRLHTTAYLHHLFKAHETTYDVLATQHNVQYMVDYMAALRQRILNDDL